MPGGVKVQLYEPKYKKRASNPKPAAKPAPARVKTKRSKIAAKRRRR